MTVVWLPSRGLPMVMPGFHQAQKGGIYAYYPFPRWKHRGTQGLATSQLESGGAGTQPRLPALAYTVTTWLRPHSNEPFEGV